MKAIDNERFVAICATIMFIVLIITIGSCSYYTDKAYIDKVIIENCCVKHLNKNSWICSPTEEIKK